MKMRDICYFNYFKAAKKIGMTQSEIENLEKEIKKEFPADILLFELHFIRVIKSKIYLVKRKKRELLKSKKVPNQSVNAENAPATI
jgi:hypothetical protein